MGVPQKAAEEDPNACAPAPMWGDQDEALGSWLQPDTAVAMWIEPVSGQSLCLYLSNNFFFKGDSLTDTALARV